MNSLLTVGRLFLLMNGLLVLTWLLLLGSKHLLLIFNLRARHQHLARCAQFFIMLALFLPPSLYIIPTNQLPRVDLWAFQPASEGVQKNISKTLHKAKRVFGPIREKGTDKKADFLQDFFKNITIPIFLLLIWLSGFIYVTHKMLKNILRLRSLLEESTVIKHIGRVRVVVSEKISVPFSTLVGKFAWAVLPLNILQNAKDLKLALKHEFQHHRQGDTLWAIAIEILICFFYFNPVIYLWKKEIIELQEFSCDEALIGQSNVSKHDYGSCLVRVAETALESRPVFVGTTCMATTSKNPIYFKTFLRRRIEMFIYREKFPARRWTGIVIGTLGVLLTFAVAYGTERVSRDLEEGPINPGTVAVDQTIQNIAETALADAIKSEKAAAGFAIVADPDTGKILAIANIDTKNERPGHWALAQLMEPASQIKTFVAAEAIEEGKTTPQESIACENGSYSYGGKTYHDWKTEGWDHLTTEDIIAVSSDIGSMKLAEKLGSKGLLDMLVKFGFGPDGSAKAFPEARIGQLPVADDSGHLRMIPYVSDGYGFRISPVEMLQAYGAIANGGNLMVPQEASDNSSARIARRVLSTESAAKMKEILRQVVLKGTGKPHASSDLYSTAGKTASSYIPDVTEGEQFDGKKKGNYAGFIGFAPVSKPKIEVYVGIRDPHNGNGGAHGGEHAAPVFKRIVEDVLKQMKVPTDKPQT